MVTVEIVNIRRNNNCWSRR